MRLTGKDIKFHFVATLIVSVSAVSTCVAVEVKLRERVTPKTSVVRLGDVAEISTADRQQARQLAAVPLMPAPAPETDRYVLQREIADMLTASGVDVADIRFCGPPQVAVVGKGLVVPAAFNEPATSGPIASPDKRSAILAGANVRTEAVQLDETQANALKAIVCRIVGDYVKLKSGSKAIGSIECNIPERQLARLAMANTAPVCSGGNAPWTGRQSFVLAFPTPNGPANVQVVANIAEPPFAAVVATRSVARGSVITAADIELRMVEPSAKMSGSRVIVDSLEKIIGHEARQVLQASEVVFADEVRSPLLVKRGELITVASQGGGIRVSTSAKALQDGAQGDLIQVEAPDSKQRYDARIVGLRQATIFTPTRVATPKRTEQVQTARAGRPGK